MRFLIEYTGADARPLQFSDGFPAREAIRYPMPEIDGHFSEFPAKVYFFTIRPDMREID